MFCKNCNQQLNGSEKFCGNCGCKIESNNTNIVDDKSNNRKASLLSLLSLLLTFGSPLVKKLLVSLVGNNEFVDRVLYYEILLGLVLMIIARVKAPKNKFSGFVMWIYIALIALIVIGAIIYAILIVILLGSCIGGLGQTG